MKKETLKRKFTGEEIAKMKEEEIDEDFLRAFGLAR